MEQFFFWPETSCGNFLRAGDFITFAIQNCMYYV